MFEQTKPPPAGFVGTDTVRHLLHDLSGRVSGAMLALDMVEYGQGTLDLDDTASWVHAGRKALQDIDGLLQEVRRALKLLGAERGTVDRVRVADLLGSSFGPSAILPARSAELAAGSTVVIVQDQVGYALIAMATEIRRITACREVDVIVSAAGAECAIRLAPVAAATFQRGQSEAEAMAPFQVVLELCKALLASSKGRLRLDRVPSGGLTATFFLPFA